MASTATGKFDLNMEEVLEAWGPADAVRELLANALDEQALTGTAEPKEFFATVLHEMAHPISGAPDQTLPFEHALTQLLGQVSYHAVQD